MDSQIKFSTRKSLELMTKIRLEQLMELRQIKCMISLSKLLSLSARMEFYNSIEKQENHVQPSHISLDICNDFSNQSDKTEGEDKQIKLSGSQIILGPKFDQFSVQTENTEQLQRIQLEDQINNRLNAKFPIKFAFNRLVPEILTEDGVLISTELLVPNIYLSRTEYSWNQSPSPRLLALSKTLRNTLKSEVPENNLLNSLKELEIQTTLSDHPNESRSISPTKQKETPSSASRKAKSSVSLESLNEQEQAQIWQHLDQLRDKLQTFPNLARPDDPNNFKSDNVDLESTSSSDKGLVFPDYVTKSKRKSHQYQVKQWLKSNY